LGNVPKFTDIWEKLGKLGKLGNFGEIWEIWGKIGENCGKLWKIGENWETRFGRYFSSLGGEP
jgi:hypothetical protein